MKVELIDSVEEFIEATITFRAADPLRTNVIGSVAFSVAGGDRAYDNYRWWIVRDDGGGIVGLAMRTSPFNMVVSPMPKDAARSLGRMVSEFDDTFPGIIGSVGVIDALIEGYVASNSAGSTRRLVERRRDLLYELEGLVLPAAQGRGRPARGDEAELLAHMYVAFADEATVPPISLTEARDMTARRIKDLSLFCWEVNGQVVALAGHAPIVMTDGIAIGRVGPVYTPMEHRRRGFGSAVTAHVSYNLIEKGARVMLFTDAANLTSNAIYQAIGFRLVDDMVQMGFEVT